VLRELFAALGNDPYVVAECLARPALADRLARSFYAHDQRFHGGLRQSAQAELANQPVAGMQQTSGTYSEIEWVKSDDESGIVGQPRTRAGLPNKQSAAEAPALQQPREATNAVKMTDSEWQDNVQKLAATFASPKTG